MAKDHRLDFSFNPVDLVRFLAAWAKQSVKTFIAIFVVVGRQFQQIVSGLASFAKESELETYVPEWFLRLTLYAIPKALMGDEPSDQIEGAIILIGWSIATSLFTGMLTAGFVLFWGAFLMIGIVRYSDWGSNAWDKGTSVSLPGRKSGGRYSTRGRD